MLAFSLWHFYHLKSESRTTFICSETNTSNSWHYSCPRSVYCRSIVFLFYFIFILLFCHTQWITSRIKTIINRLTNIKFKICALLGRSDCGGEISEKPSLWGIEISLILLLCNISITLKLKGHRKGRLISRILNFEKNLSSGLKIIR